MADEDKDKAGSDPATGFQSLLAKKNGDALQLASQLFDENYNLRRNRDSLKAEIEEVKRKLPADGSLILAPDKAKEYEEYQALGPAKELKTRIEAHETLETEVKDLKKKDLLREVADLHSYKLSVLLDRDKAAGGLEIEIKEDKDKRKAAYVKDGDKEIPITEFAESNWADYMPSLKAEQASSQQTTRTGAVVTDPRPKTGNGKDAFEHSKNSMMNSGKYAGL